MAKGLLLVELDLDDDNLKELKENQDKLRRALVDGIWGALSWYGDDNAQVEEMSIALGPTPRALCRVAANSFRGMSVREKTRWTEYFLEELDDYDADSCDMLERVHHAIESRIYMGMRW
jgi:hypothetical protein